MTPRFLVRVLGWYAEKRGFEIRTASGYAEPGCSDPECGIIAFANWNSESHWDAVAKQFFDTDTTMPRILKVFERAGIPCEWSDEWDFCSDCDKAVRTEPDSYSWTRSYWDTGDGIVCQDCVLKDPADYLAWLEGNEDRAMKFDLDLHAAGYRKLEGDFQSGLHYGQDASPKAIADSLRKMGVERFIFKIDSTGQFDLSFSVWVHKAQMRRVRDWEKANKRCDPGMSPAEICESGLRAASKAMDSVPPGIGPVVVKVTGDGVEVKRVSPQDFVDGKALD